MLLTVDVLKVDWYLSYFAYKHQFFSKLIFQQLLFWKYI